MKETHIIALGFVVVFGFLFNTINSLLKKNYLSFLAKIKKDIKESGKLRISAQKELESLKLAIKEFEVEDVRSRENAALFVKNLEKEFSEKIQSEQIKLISSHREKIESIERLKVKEFLQDFFNRLSKNAEIVIRDSEFDVSEIDEEKIKNSIH